VLVDVSSESLLVYTSNYSGNEEYGCEDTQSKEDTQSDEEQHFSENIKCIK